MLNVNQLQHPWSMKKKLLMSSNISIIIYLYIFYEQNSTIFFFRFGSRNTQLPSTVYSGSEDGTIKLWDLRIKEKCVSVFKGKEAEKY